MKRRSRKNQGVSTVIGTILFMMLFLVIASILFTALFGYNNKLQQANSLEDMRSQERIAISNVKLDNDKIVGVYVNNSGAITVQLRAFYLDNQFVCDLSDPSLNTNGGYINAQESQLVNVTPITYGPNNNIAITTSRGTRAIELQSNYIFGSISTANPPETYYGPLRLNFTLFYYRDVDSSGSPLGPWHEGSKVSASTVYCEWKITVTNVDTRDITLDKYSCFTLISNDGGSQFPWYTNYPGQLIRSKQTVTISYLWSGPLPATTAEGFQGFNSQTAKTFLTFFGKFSDGSVYGQTIPFEAILRV
jgi:archaellum component FlaF (FlaF/FlaG flagellin family)